MVSAQPRAASGEHVVIWMEYKSLIVEGLCALVPASYYLVVLFMVSQVNDNAESHPGCDFLWAVWCVGHCVGSSTPRLHLSKTARQQTTHNVHLSCKPRPPHLPMKSLNCGFSLFVYRTPARCAFKKEC